MASFFDRLKERKLFQWALAYAAGAWVLLEATGFVSDRFAWPEVIVRALTILAGVGFLVTLVLAWYHGEKGRQTVSGPELLLIAGLLGIAGGLMAILARPDGDAEAGTDAPAFAAMSSLGPASVAVLPFTGSSATEEDQTDFFVDGIHSEILTQLSKIASLEVIGRASVMRFVNSDEPVQSIGAQLGVASLLEGTVLRAGERVRMNVRLLDAGSGREMWAEAYERELTVEQLFAIQADIALRIASALQATLGAGLSERIAARPTDDLEAYDHYLRGKGYEQRSLHDQAIESYQLAVDADPDFAIAWAALSRRRVFRYWSNNVRNFDDREMAFRALERAQQLAAEDADTHLALGFSYHYGTSWPHPLDRTAEQYSLVSDLQPSWVEPILALGRVRRHQGQWDDALALFERATALDPLDPQPVLELGRTQQYLRNFDDAERYLVRAAALGSSDAYPLRVELRLFGRGDTLAARQLIEEASIPVRPRWQRWLAYFRRDLPALTALVSEMPSDSAGIAASWPRYVWLVRFERLTHDSSQVRVYADSLELAARERLRRSIEIGVSPGFVAYSHAEIGWALALLGKEEEALRQAALATEMFPVEADYWNADYVYTSVAQIHMVLGNTEAAIDEIEHLLTFPNDDVSPATLRLDPDFDPLRDHPRFQALLAKYGSEP